jgi:hypothetical protein
MISQPRYLPSLTYLQRINQCDIFIILDTVQHNRQDFEHRNRIGDRSAVRWLSLALDRSIGSRSPIQQLQLISDSCISQHCELILSAYRNADYYEEKIIRRLYEPFYTLDLVPILIEMLHRTFHLLGAQGKANDKWLRASSLPVEVVKGPDYLVSLCKQVGASHYISGPNGRHYIASQFANADLQVSFHSDESPLYPRSGQPELPWLAWVDALHHQGIEYVRNAIRRPMTLTS